VLNFYSSTRVNRPPEVRDRATAGLRSNRFEASIIKKWLCAVLCLVFVFSAPGVAVPQTVHADDGGYLLDKVITWADGSTEHVQIDNERFFVIDGVKRKLVGMVLTTTYMPYQLAADDGTEFYLTDNLDIYDRELTYLESVGVRVVAVHLKYIRWYTPNHSIQEEEAGFTALLDLIYKHKMLIIAQVTGKWMPNFSNASNPDFSWNVNGGTDSWGAFLERCSNILAKYSNVVAVSADNELDDLLKAEDCPWDPNFTDQNYGPAEVTNYLNFFMGILRQLSVPVIHKLEGTSLERLDIKAACLAATDFPAFDCYATNAKDMDTQLDNLVSWLSQAGFPTTGWWCMEFNAGWDPVKLGNLNVGLIESIFNHGATIAILFPSNWSIEPTWQLFDNDGKPVPKLVEIAQEIPRLQASLSAPPVVVATASLPIAPALSTASEGHYQQQNTICKIVQAPGVALQP
jgi:hypothetical protein